MKKYTFFFLLVLWLSPYFSYGESIILTQHGRKYFSGDLSLSIDLVSQRTLQGIATIEHGMFYGYDISSLIESAQENFKKDRLYDANKKITFTTLSAHYQIQNGILIANHIQILAEDLSLLGQMQINLQNQHIHAVLNLTYHKGQLNLNMPIEIKGTLQKPKFSISFKQLNLHINQNKLNQILNFLK